MCPWHVSSLTLSHDEALAPSMSDDDTFPHSLYLLGYFTHVLHLETRHSCHQQLQYRGFFCKHDKSSVRLLNSFITALCRFYRQGLCSLRCDDDTTATRPDHGLSSPKSGAALGLFQGEIFCSAGLTMSRHASCVMRLPIFFISNKPAGLDCLACI